LSDIKFGQYYISVDLFQLLQDQDFKCCRHGDADMCA